MQISEFEKQLKALDPNFSIVPNPNRSGLNNIFYNGENYDLPPVPDNIREEFDATYFYTFPNGVTSPHYAVKTVMPRIRDFLKNLPAIKKEYEDLKS